MSARRTSGGARRSSSGVVGDARLAAAALLELVAAKPDRGHLRTAREHYANWRERPAAARRPELRPRGIVQKVRSTFDNPDDRIRPEALAVAIDRHAAHDAIFTSDTGMSTVWLSRFVPMSGTRRLVGSYNLGSMANAMPQALGAQALDRARQVVAFCGDGGLTMLLGDLITAVAHDLPVRLVVFNNGRLGMVKLEQEQGGLPEFGTRLATPIWRRSPAPRACTPSGSSARPSSRPPSKMRSPSGPVLLDVGTNPEEVSLPPQVEAADAWGFAIAKLTETLESRRT